MLCKIDILGRLAYKLRFTRPLQVCYIARNGISDCLNDGVSPGQILH